MPSDQSVISLTFRKAEYPTRNKLWQAPCCEGIILNRGLWGRGASSFHRRTSPPAFHQALVCCLVDRFRPSRNSKDRSAVLILNFLRHHVLQPLRFYLHILSFYAPNRHPFPSTLFQSSSASSRFIRKVSQFPFRPTSLIRLFPLRFTYIEWSASFNLVSITSSASSSRLVSGPMVDLRHHFYQPHYHFQYPLRGKFFHSAVIGVLQSRKGHWNDIAFYRNISHFNVRFSPKLHAFLDASQSMVSLCSWYALCLVAPDNGCVAHVIKTGFHTSQVTLQLMTSHRC